MCFELPTCGFSIASGTKKKSAILIFQLADMVTLTTEQKVALACCQMATTHINQCVLLFRDLHLQQHGLNSFGYI